MKRKAILGVVLSCLLLGMTTGCGQTNEEGVSNLKVDLEQYELSCDNVELGNEIKGKIVQIENYRGEVNSEQYSTIILTNDGNIYLYDSMFGEVGEIIKISGTTELTHIDGTLDTGGRYSNPIIYGDGKCYEISKEGTIANLNYDFEEGIILIQQNQNAKVLNKDGQVILYSLQESDDSAEETWVRYTPTQNSFVSKKMEYANRQICVAEDGKVYLLSAWGWLKTDADTLTYDSEIPAEEQILSVESPIGVWYWSSKGGLSSSDLLVQTSDNNLHYKSGAFTSDLQFDAVIPFDDKLENFYAETKFLLVGEKNVYVAEKVDGNYQLTQLDGLKKYKEDIRGAFMSNSVMYVLLSDGNLYKAYEG